MSEVFVCWTKRVSVHICLVIILFKWDADPLVATDTKRTNPTLSHAITVVCLTPRFVSTTLVRKSHSGMTSLAACISSQKRRKWLVLNLLSQLVLLPTSTWPPRQVKTLSTCVSVFTHGTLSASIRCCHALVQIDSSKVCVKLSVSLTLRPLALLLIKFLCPSEPNQILLSTQKKLSTELVSSLLVVRLYSSPVSTDSPNTSCPNFTVSKRKVKFKVMALV